MAGGRGSRPAHGSDASPGSFLGVEFHPALDTLGEDDGVRGEKELEGLTKKYVDTVDALLKGKENELLEV